MLGRLMGARAFADMGRVPMLGRLMDSGAFAGMGRVSVFGRLMGARAFADMGRVPMFGRLMDSGAFAGMGRVSVFGRLMYHAARIVADGPIPRPLPVSGRGAYARTVDLRRSVRRYGKGRLCSGA